MRILVIDSHNDQRPDDRLPRLLAGLGRFGVAAESYRSVRRADHDFHDLASYDVALVHESDARLDNAGFYKLCVRAATPCVLFSGGTGRARSEGDRLLFVSDEDAVAHAEAGLLFWQRTGRLDVVAWTQGLTAARRAEVNRLCEPLRRALRSSDDPAGEWDSIAGVPEALKPWVETAAFGRVVGELAGLLAKWDAGLGASWLEEHRERLQRLLRDVVAAA